jgi:hypothetical protein
MLAVDENEPDIALAWDGLDWLSAVLALVVIDVGAVIALTVVPPALTAYACNTRPTPPPVAAAGAPAPPATLPPRRDRAVLFGFGCAIAVVLIVFGSALIWSVLRRGLRSRWPAEENDPVDQYVVAAGGVSHSRTRETFECPAPRSVGIEEAVKAADATP